MEEEIKYSPVVPEDIDDINDFLVTQFFAHEPLGKHLGCDSEKDVRPWLPKLTGPMIGQGVRQSL